MEANDSSQKTIPWPDPTEEMLKDPLFEKIWQVIKSWDVSVPEAYQGYCGATGNHARAIYDAIRTPSENRSFPFAKPRKWKSKNDSKKTFKVLPWFQPISEDSRFDFKGLLKEVMPELHDDLMKDFDVYSGLVLQVGWQFLNEHDVWLCFPKSWETEFEDLGEWIEPTEGEKQQTKDDPK